MKKICLFLVIMFLPFIIYAKEYDLKEINLSLSINEDWYVFTRGEFPESDEIQGLGITEEFMNQYMDENSVYLDAMPKDFSYELILNTTSNTTEVYNMKNCSNAFLKEVVNGILEKISDATANVYDSGKNKYIVVSFYDIASSYYIYRYYTIVNNMIYHFNIQKKSEISDNEKASLKRVVDTVDFTFLPQYQKEKNDIQKEINGNGKNEWWKNVLIDAGIGGLIGGVSSLLIAFINKRKKAKLDKELEETSE